MSALWSIAHGQEAEHAAKLKLGLTKMPSGFLARVCPLCDGKGLREQMYCDGPNGELTHLRLRGGCDYCDGTGLLQGDKPAPDSVRSQVLTAADTAKTQRQLCDGPGLGTDDAGD